jgi:ribosome-binding factor A
MARIDRVREQIQHEASKIIQSELKDPRIGMVTVTNAEVSSDFRYAKIYYTVYGDEQKRRETQEGLESAASFIRTQIGQRVRLRFTPEISFAFDYGMDKAMHVYDLLAQIEAENKEKEKEQSSE